MSSRLRSLNSTKISFFAFQDIITSVSGILILVTLILATELDRPSSRTTHDADPELERKLSETLRQQAEVDTKNRNLQGLLAAAEAAPATEKLETDITRLRAQLAEEKKKHASVAEQLAASQAAIEARDRILGLTDLKAQIQRITQEAESLAREEAKVRDEMARLEQRVASVQSKLLKLQEREGKLWLIPDKSSTTKEPILAIISGSGAKVERFDHPDQVKQFSKASAHAEFGSYLGDVRPLDQYVVFLVRPSGIELFDRLVRLAREKGFEVGFDALEEDKDIYYSTPPIIDETTPSERRTAPREHGDGGYSDPRGGAGDVAGAEVGGRGDPSRNGGSSATSTSGGRTGTTTTGSAGSDSRGGSARGGSTEPSASSPSQAGGGGQGGKNPGGGSGTAAGMDKGQASAAQGGGGSGASGETGDGKGSSNSVSARHGKAGGGGGKEAGDDASLSTQAKKAPPKSPPQPASPLPPKAKSWWQRFLEWVGLR